MLIVFTVLVEQLERKRYLDSLELTEEQEKILLNVDGIIIEDYVQNKTEKSAESIVLTKKEREILQLLTEGKTSKEIAAQLNIAKKTVETHRVNIMNKLDIRSVAELTKYAIRHGITCLDS